MFIPTITKRICKTLFLKKNSNITNTVNESAVVGIVARDRFSISLDQVLCCATIGDRSNVISD